MKKILAFTIGLLAIAGAGVLGVAGWAGSLMESGVEDYGPTVIGTPVQVADTDIHLFAGTATMTGFAVANPPTFSDESAIAVDRLDIRLEPLSVFSNTVRIERIHVDSPRIRLEISPKGTNLDVIRRHIQKVTKGPDQGPSGRSVAIEELRITGAEISAAPADLGKRAKFTVPDIVLNDLTSATGTGKAGMTKRIVEALYAAVYKKMKSSDVVAKVGDIFENADQVRQEMRRTIGDIKEKIDERAREQLEKLFD